MWDEVLNTDLNEEDIKSAASLFLEKKLKGSLDEADLNRAANSLVRRGFSYEQARQAINNYIEESTDNSK